MASNTTSGIYGVEVAFSRRYATEVPAPAANRGLKPTATVKRRYATDSCPDERNRPLSRPTQRRQKLNPGRPVLVAMANARDGLFRLRGPRSRVSPRHGTGRGDVYTNYLRACTPPALRLALRLDPARLRCAPHEPARSGSAALRSA